jgi:DNA-binding PadR family transcriptional regulator
MPEADRIPDALILAAIKRARIHQRRRDEGVSISQIKAHLALPHNGWTTRQIQPQLERVEAAGLIVREWRHSRTLWSVTPTGRRQASPFRELPESPQHRRWREARVLAEQEAERVWTGVLAVVEEAEQFVNNPPEPTPLSAAWLALGKRLEGACSLMASVTYCLHAWPEPDDSKADIEPRSQWGLRNTRKWSER